MTARVGFAVLIVLLSMPVVHAATISGPTSSTTGTFTLTWPSGYNLRPVNGSWQFASSPTTSFAFTSLPSGEYQFALWTCWPQYDPPLYYTECAQDPASVHTVVVTRDAEPTIDTATTAAGTTPYSADVSLRGSARVDVPIQVIPGLNGLAPNLSLSYDSARKGDLTDFYSADDTLGYGWHLNGASVITRCRGGLSGAAKPLLDTTDRLCLDGQPLLAVAGAYWNVNTEYRTEQQSFVKVIGKFTSGIGSWYEVHYPDGRIATYGDTADSQVVGSGAFNNTGGNQVVWVGPNPAYQWAIRQVTNGFGDTLTYSYDRFDPYGMLQLKAISYAGATIEFKYGPRADLLNVYVGSGGGGSGSLWRQSVLHTVRLRMNGSAVREYRLDSNLNGGYLRLEQIQACGYDISGTSASCLKPLNVGWTAVAGGASPISMTTFTDGLGAVTEYVYTAISTSSNPSTYAEVPFGNTTAVSGTAARAIAVATEMKRSDGLTSAGRRRTTLAYKGLAYASTVNRGFIGFYEVRAKDEQSGVYTYTQTRLDFPTAGAVSQVRRFTGVFPTGTELDRQEHAFATKSQTANVKYVYPLRSTSWVFEGSSTVGGSKVVYTPCFRTLSGDTCPGTGTEYETVSQMASTTTVGNTVSNPTFTPTVWGDVPDRTVSNVELTTTATVNFQNTTTPWVAAAPIKTIVTDTATGESARTVTSTFTYKSGTRELLTANRLPGDPTLNLLMTRTFTGNNLTAATVSGSGITSRSITYGPTFTEDRYPDSVSNALSHTTNLDYDLRFGQANDLTDPDGNVTAIEYDAFGRHERVTVQDGSETLTSYARCDLTDCSAVTGAVAAVKITTSVSNGSTQVAPTQVRYLDVLGREVLSEVEALASANGWHRQRTVFNSRALV